MMKKGKKNLVSGQSTQSDANSLDRLPEAVTLVTPPSVFLLDERVFVSLGILKIAAILEQRGVAVEGLDLSGIENYLDALKAHLLKTKSKFIGITATTPQLPSVVEIIKIIRVVRPDMRVILGGPHVTLSHSALKLEQKSGTDGRAHKSYTQLETLADVLVSGDGELAVLHALMPTAPKLIDGDDPKGGLFLSDEMYEKTPLPARHLVDLSTYKYEIEGHRATSLIAQLGCPFACGFCGGRNSKSLRIIRTRSAESIVAEVKMLYETHGFTGFMFYDDELNVNKDMIALMGALARLQDQLKVEFRLRGFIKSQLFTLAQAEAMHRAGFRWILTGFESGSPRILENINKRATLDDNNRTMAIAKKAGLKVKALMSIGHPGETEQTVEQTQAWLLQAQPDDFDCTLITTYPGTPYYDEAVPHETLSGVWTYTIKKNGDRLHAHEVDYTKTAEYYKGNPDGGYKSFIFTDALSAEQLVLKRDWIERSVREKLGIAYPTARPALRFEHSMGQGSNLLISRPRKKAA
jgi:anaerobic magnesium-protoporphyrin IX monomethyl ester cyclase